MKVDTNRLNDSAVRTIRHEEADRRSKTEYLRALRPTKEAEGREN
ncbi:hypothetical protein LJR245_007223 [Rhizobium leguminosarum]|nr:hypothetical protein [Rhizobium leguminosarum]